MYQMSSGRCWIPKGLDRDPSGPSRRVDKRRGDFPFLDALPGLSLKITAFLHTWSCFLSFQMPINSTCHWLGWTKKTIGGKLNVFFDQSSLSAEAPNTSWSLMNAVDVTWAAMMAAASKGQGQFNEKGRRLHGLWNCSSTPQNICRRAFSSGSIIIGNISCLTSRQAAPLCGWVTFSIWIFV